MIKFAILFVLIMLTLGVFGAFRLRSQKCRRCGRPLVARHGQACRCTTRAK